MGRISCLEVASNDVLKIAVGPSWRSVGRRVLFDMQVLTEFVTEEDSSRLWVWGIGVRRRLCIRWSKRTASMSGLLLWPSWPSAAAACEAWPDGGAELYSPMLAISCCFNAVVSKTRLFGRKVFQLAQLLFFTGQDLAPIFHSVKLHLDVNQSSRRTF